MIQNNFSLKLSEDDSILKYTIAFILGYVNLVNVFYVFAYNITNASFFIKVFPVTKDLVVIFLLFSVFCVSILQKKFKLKRYLLPLYVIMVLYCAWILIGLVSSPAPFMYKAYNMRSLTVFVIALLAFINIGIGSHDLVFIKKIVVIITMLISVFGLFEFFMPDFLWDTIIGLKKYTTNRAGGGTMVNRSYSSDLKFLIGRPVRRMLSFYAEPVTLGSYFTFTFAYFTFTSKNIKYRKLLLCLVFICGLLVVSKLFVLAIIVILGYKYILKKPVFYPLILFSAILYFVAGYLYEVFGKAHGSFSHLFGYYTGIDLLADYPLGFGLGMAGNKGFLQHNSVTGEFGGESGLGNIIAQIGYPGFLFLIMILFIMYLFKKKFNEANNPEYLGLFVALFTYVINFYLSSASLGLTGNIMFFIFAGIYLNPNLVTEELSKIR